MYNCIQKIKNALRRGIILENTKKKPGLLDRWMNVIEKLGNKLPDPITLFIILIGIVMGLSFIFAWMGVTATHPGNGDVLEVRNLLSADGFRMILRDAVVNFSSFAPLGMVLVAVIGSSVAEKSGLLVALMKKMLKGVKPSIVTFAIIFIAINANVAGDAGFIIMPALAAIVYLGMGRHPLLGMFVAFGGVAAGFSANMLLGMSDALAYTYTEEAAKLIDPSYMQSPAINYYFLIVSCILLSVAGTLLVEKFLIKRFPVTEKQVAIWKNTDNNETDELTAGERKGLRWAGIGTLIYIVVVALLCFVPIGGTPLMADEVTGSVMDSTAPFMKGIVVLVSLLLMIPGILYGFGTGRYKNDKDVYADVTDGFKDMAGYIFLCFFIAQFTNYFAWTNLGTVGAIKGAEGLKAMNFTGIPLLIGLIVVACIVNLFIGSASAKWAILAPVFIPMMMILGFDPAVTQVAYRIGDSITNPLSPLFSYLPIILGIARKYKKDTGVGTIIANMVPFSMTFAVVWIIQLVVWVLLRLPLGPGGNIFL